MATNKQIENFINEIAPLAQKYAKAYGYKICSPCIAQALQESLSKDSKPKGLSTLAYKYNNYHGLKCGSGWTGRSVNLATGEEVNGVDIKIRSDFRVFDDMASGVEGYYVFLKYNRYAKAKEAKTPLEYLTIIKNAGYATDSSYVTSCMQKVILYELTKYDNFDVVPQTTLPKDKKSYKVGTTYTLQANMYVRTSPAGAKCKFDNLTIDAKNHGYFDDKGNAILTKGTRVTCREVDYIDGNVWIRIPSGWVCAWTRDKEYIS